MGCLHQPPGSTQSVVPHVPGADMESRLEADTLSVINGSLRAFARCVAEGMMSHARFAGACLSMLAAAAIGFGLVTTAQAETQLGRAYRIIAGKQFVDLTHSFGPNTPVWSGFGQAKMTPAVDPQTRQPYTIAKDGFRSTFYEMVGQYGTHVDPPAHFAPDGITMDHIPLKEMILPLLVFAAPALIAKDPNRAFSPDDLRAWERRHGRVRKGVFAALRTDLSK